MNVSAQEHILKLKMPFQIDTFRIYVFVTILKYFHIATCGCGISTINSLIIILILHIGDQIDILCDWLLKAFSKNTMNTVDGTTMKTLITKHQQIIMFSENIENLYYTYIALMLFVSDIIIICCLGFIIIISIGTPGGTPILMRSVLYYIVMNFEAFIYCFAGEYLNVKSKMISDAVYNSLWYDITIEKKRMILFMILRSQK
ncbi:odorant receptor 22c-like [Mycetomoellerius zeteki]|uniref:odorant receptor 22c-like n=1 Tax=Mycetomoellerius zeteki TaxID=64791 RepID=UPI00084E66A6|nr:PREDICTED: odorant receptor 22c-like [Trachymyrmex zeteki]